MFLLRMLHRHITQDHSQNHSSCWDGAAGPERNQHPNHVVDWIAGNRTWNDTNSNLEAGSVGLKTDSGLLSGMDLGTSQRQPLLLGGADERQELSARALRACLAAEAALASLRAECAPLESMHLRQGGDRNGAGSEEAATSTSSTWKNLELARRSLQLQIDACENFALCATAAFKQLCNVHFSDLGMNDAEHSGHYYSSSPSVQKISPMPTAENAWKKKGYGHRTSSSGSKRLSFSSPASHGHSLKGAPPPSSHGSACTLQIHEEEAPSRIILSTRNSLASLLSTSGSDSEDGASNAVDFRESFEEREDFKSLTPSPALSFEPPIPRPRVLSPNSSSISVSSTLMETSQGDPPTEFSTGFPTHPNIPFSEVRENHQNTATSADPPCCTAKSRNIVSLPLPFAKSSITITSLARPDSFPDHTKSRAGKDSDFLKLRQPEASSTPSHPEQPPAESKRNAQPSETSHPSPKGPATMAIPGSEAPIECDRCTRPAESSTVSQSRFSAAKTGASIVTSRVNECNNFDSSSKGESCIARKRSCGDMHPEALGCVNESSSKRDFTSSPSISLTEESCRSESPEIHDDFFVRTSLPPPRVILGASPEPPLKACETARIHHSHETSSPSPTAEGDSRTDSTTPSRPKCFQHGATDASANQRECRSSYNDDDARSSTSQTKFINLSFGSFPQESKSLSSDLDELRQHHIVSQKTSKEPEVEWPRTNQTFRGTEVPFSGASGISSTVFSGNLDVGFRTLYSHAGESNTLISARPCEASSALPSYGTRNPRLLQEQQLQMESQQSFRGSSCSSNRGLHPEPSAAHKMWSSCDFDASDSRGKHSTGGSRISSSSSTAVSVSSLAQAVITPTPNVFGGAGMTLAQAEKWQMLTRLDTEFSAKYQGSKILQRRCTRELQFA